MLESKDSLIYYFNNKYEIDIEDCEVMYECAYEILLRLLFPFKNNMTEIPANILSRHKTWLYRAMQEFVERNGMTSYLNYTENGINVRFDRTQLSQSLIDEITPFGGVI